MLVSNTVAKLREASPQVVGSLVHRVDRDVLLPPYLHDKVVILHDAAIGLEQSFEQFKPAPAPPAHGPAMLKYSRLVQVEGERTETISIVRIHRLSPKQKFCFGFADHGKVFILPCSVRRQRSLSGGYLRVARCFVNVRLQTIWLFAVIILLLVPCSVFADIITFEDLPDTYFFTGGDQNIGSYYPGITFGPDVTGLSVSDGYDSSGFPPHSGDVVIWDAADPTITISFGSPLDSFGIWYTSYDPLTLQAFDSGNNLLGTATGDPNTDGSTGTSSFLSLSDPGIESVTLTSTPGFFVLDDLTFETGTTAVPEPSMGVLLAISLAGLLGVSVFRSKRFSC